MHRTIRCTPRRAPSRTRHHAPAGRARPLALRSPSASCLHSMEPRVPGRPGRSQPGAMGLLSGCELVRHRMWLPHGHVSRHWREHAEEARRPARARRSRSTAMAGAAPPLHPPHHCASAPLHLCTSSLLHLSTSPPLDLCMPTPRRLCSFSSPTMRSTRCRRSCSSPRSCGVRSECILWCRVWPARTHDAPTS